MGPCGDWFPKKEVADKPEEGDFNHSDHDALEEATTFALAPSLDKNSTMEVLEPAMLGRASTLDAALDDGDDAQLESQVWACGDAATHEFTRLCMAAAVTAVLCKFSVSFERNLMSANAILHQVL